MDIIGWSVSLIITKSYLENQSTQEMAPLTNKETKSAFTVHTYGINVYTW
jgi:hypothetical protein